MTLKAQGSINRTARLAGGLYLALIPLGFFSFAYVPALIQVRGDAAATCSNLLAHEALFRAGTVSHLISQIIVVFLVLALYRLLRPVNKHGATLMAVLALICVPISCLTEVYNNAALQVLGNASDGAFTPAQLQAQVMLLLGMNRTGIMIAQVFWGLWMLPLSFLVFRSGFLPRWLAAPILIAAAGYLFDSATHLLYPGQPTISQYTAVAELLLPVWLLSKGVVVDRWEGVAEVSGQVGNYLFMLFQFNYIRYFYSLTWPHVLSPFGFLGTSLAPQRAIGA